MQKENRDRTYIESQNMEVSVETAKPTAVGI